MFFFFKTCKQKHVSSSKQVKASFPKIQLWQCQLLKIPKCINTVISPIGCSYSAKHREGAAKLLNHSPHNRHLYRSCDSHVSLARGVVGDGGLAADLTRSVAVLLLYGKEKWNSWRYYYFYKCGKRKALHQPFLPLMNVSLIILKCILLLNFIHVLEALFSKKGIYYGWNCA